MSTLKPLVTFKSGDVVDITIKGARVSPVSELVDGGLGVAFDCDAGRWAITLPPGAPGVTIELVSPAAWPPRTGDLWRDDNGMLYLGLQRLDDDRLDLISVAGDVIPQDELLDRKPTLVHREATQ